MKTIKALGNDVKQIKARQGEAGSKSEACNSRK